MENELKLYDQRTFIFSGDYMSAEEIFTALSSEIMSYTNTSSGKPRKNFEVLEKAKDFLIVRISFAEIELRKFGVGNVVLSYNCGLDRYGWDIRNTASTLYKLECKAQDLAEKYNYKLNMDEHCSKVYTRKGV